MSKIVVLNSGGFDSVVLTHEVKSHNPEAEIHNLFFSYGQFCINSERECSKKCADKLGLVFKEISIPKFDWSNSVLSGGTDENQYIPLRNLVFISYALSYAESVGADKIYCAFIDPEDEYYEDTSPLFVERLNDLTHTFGIEVLAPFIKCHKEGMLKALARLHGIYEDDVHSCNFGDTPCGVCSDCVSLKEIFDEVVNRVSDDILLDNDFNITPDFIRSVRYGKVTSAKLYINNACQFSCSHCFIGKKKLFRQPLVTEEWCEVIENMYEYGITSIDFFGKEPLFNDRIFALLEKCKSLGIKYSLITNGVNVEKYIDQLSYYKPTMALSVENLGRTKYRDSGSFIEHTIGLLLSRDIKVSLSIDLNDSNSKKLIPMIKRLYKLGVRDFYIKPLRPFGDSEHFMMDKMITPKNLYKCIRELRKFDTDANITLSLAMMDVERLYQYDKEEFYEHFGLLIHNRYEYIDGIFLDLELYCHRFKDIISITPDGYMLGCASEYCTDYSHYKNVLDYSIEECINSGKESLDYHSYKGVGCYFCREYRKDSKFFE